MRYTNPHTLCHPDITYFTAQLRIFSRQASRALKCAVFPVPQQRVLKHNKCSPVPCRIHCILCTNIVNSCLVAVSLSCVVIFKLHVKACYICISLGKAIVGMCKKAIQSSYRQYRKQFILHIIYIIKTTDVATQIKATQKSWLVVKFHNFRIS